MVSKCANPGCSASFRYFREGRLFEIEVTSKPNTDPANAQRKPHRKVEYFWLCSSCATSLIVKVDEEHGVITVPLAGTAVRHATA
jgi:hypothetical protein